MTGVRPAMGYHRSTRWWFSTVCGAVAVAVALAVLRVGASAPPSVQITGGGADTPRSYDLVVSAPGASGPADTGGGWVTNPADLDTLSGGITLAQYDTIRRLAGVQVAAPMTMVGYVPFTVSVPITVPASAIFGTPRRVTLTVRLRSDNGLSTVTWDDVSMAYPGTGTGGAPPTAVQLSWTFQLPLVAVDPTAEAQLLHLDGAVTSGSYLPATATAPSEPVPMLVAGSVASDEQAEVTIDPQASGAVGGTTTLTTASAYNELVAAARESAGNVQSYWTAGPVSYEQAANGGLVPRPVAVDLAAAWDGPYMWAGASADAGALDVPFRSLTQHTALGAGAPVQAVGVFDPARVASAPGTPSPYSPQMLTGADAQSRQLLGGRPLVSDGDPGGYPGSAASLVMPLADIGAFTGGYTDTGSAAPIGVIRIRVAGAAGDSAASLRRISAVAAEIVRATGLHVEAVVGATATTRVVDLPAGLHGRPPLQVDQVWYHTDTSMTVWAGLDTVTAALSALELLGGELLIAVCTWRLMRGRREELATLRALGWPRWQLGRQLLAEFALTGAVAVAGAGLAGYAIGTTLGSWPPWAWLLITVLTTIALILVEKRRPLLRVMAAMLAGPLRADRPRWRLAGLTRRAVMPSHPVRKLLRAQVHTLLSGFTIAVACAALSLELAARWAFPGAVGSWAGRSVSWQGTVVDIAAVLIIVTMATFSAADLDLATLRERAPEMRTLRAMGWPARDLTRLALRKAVWPGLAAGLAVGTFDLLGALAMAGSVPPRLFALAVFMVAAGVTMSVLAAGISATFSRRRDSANN